MKHSYPTSEPLRFLLAMIQNREMALPDFQRDFVWDPSATDELIESIVCNFPAGSLLRIKNGKQLLFQPRAIEDAPPLGNAKPSYLILDGQQRLTSLYQAFYGVGDHRFYINLQGLSDKKELEDCVFYLRREDGEAKYGTLTQQAASLVFPFGNLATNGGFAAWASKVQENRCTNVSEMLALQQKLNTCYEQWIKPVEDYEFPMVTLNEETSGSAVCTIFETLNRTGVKLSVFDLLTARFWAEELNLRQLWADAKNENPVIEEFEIDPYYLLQIIGLIEPGTDQAGSPKAPSIKRSAMLEMKVEQARKGWPAAVDGLVRALEILRDGCGVLHASLLPYNTIVIPMAAAWSSQRESTGPSTGANRLKLLRWFWCAIFGQKYENAPNSQAEKDFGEMKSWMLGGTPPESVTSFDIAALRLRQTRPRQRAVYRGVMALIMQNGAMDFHKRGRITSQLLADKRNPVDDHHIFPRAFLNEKETSPILRDCVLNRTYIDRTTNRRLSKRAPSEYFGEIREKQGAGEIDELLKSHLVQGGSKSPVFSDDFELFLKQREEAVLTLIAEKTKASTEAARA